MTFGSDHYVPVLKIKRGEKSALQIIPAPWRSRITPLLEVVERNPETSPSVAAHLRKAFKGLNSAARLYSRCFLDVREIESDGPSAAAAVFDTAAQVGITFTPVTGLSRRADIVSALRYRSNGVAVRLTRSEFESGSLARNIRSFMSTHRLDPAEVDLLVDLGPVDQFVRYGVAALASAFLAAVPDKPRWRTLTLSACAFPASMAGVKRDSHSYVERNEWNVWREVLHANRRNLERLPTYSDCGIQHTSGVEGFDPRTMQVSATIRYTLKSDWLLIKGESRRMTSTSQQFPELANKLVYGPLCSDFAGSSHCAGCAAMKACADGAPRFGSPEVWRRLGTIHHLARVMEGLSALTWP